MRLNVLIGGKAGQGINKISEIVGKLMNEHGYFTFNYRDYPSLIRGGHNFNILCISDKRIGSYDNKLDGIIAMDEKTAEIHKKELKKDGFIIACKEFEQYGRNLNVAQSGALMKIFGLSKEVLLKEIENQFHNADSNKAAEAGYNSQKEKFNLVKLGNKILKMTGNSAIAQGAVNSGINIYMAYPMTPATGVLTELAGLQEKYGHLVFQPENEIAVANAAIGASFAGAKTMIGSSGGGVDLMTEAFSFQGMSEIPLVVYYSSRPGPGTGLPTYTIQGDLDSAMRAGHGEFPRIVVAPGDPIESIEKTNEAFYLAEKFGCLSILLGDKHLAESEFSFTELPHKPIKVEIKRKVPGEGIVKASSYEHDKFGNSTEDTKIAKVNADNRIKKYEKIKEEVKKFEMIKIHGNKNSKNLIIGWGSTKGAILDAIEGQDYKFLQVLYAKPLSDEIKKEIQKAKKVIFVENNLTGQMGRLIREKTGISIKNRILKYDGKPFTPDEINEELKKIK
jgi:2-oxoglutarate/2-oxoacid ferredoxin oxidoreductase subunit alpha